MGLPIVGVAIFPLFTQIENILEGREWNTYQFITDEVFVLTTYGIVSNFNTKLNPGWMKNLRFRNLINNLTNGKVSRYALHNFFNGFSGSIASSFVRVGFDKANSFITEKIIEFEENIKNYYKERILDTIFKW